MVELHQTIMGRKLIEHDIPEISRQLKRIADSLEKILDKQSNTELIKEIKDEILQKLEEKQEEISVNSLLKDLDGEIIADWIPLPKVQKLLEYGNTQMNVLLKHPLIKVAKVGKRKFMNRQSLEDYILKTKK
jgi:hypothetical protein